MFINIHRKIKSARNTDEWLKLTKKPIYAHRQVLSLSDQLSDSGSILFLILYSIMLPQSENQLVFWMQSFVPFFKSIINIMVWRDIRLLGVKSALFCC